MHGIFSKYMFNILKIHALHNDLPFSPQGMKTENIKKLVTNLHDKTEYVIHIRNLNQTLSHGVILQKKIPRVIKFNQKAWLRPYKPTCNNKKGDEIIYYQNQISILQSFSEKIY